MKRQYIRGAQNLAWTMGAIGAGWLAREGMMIPAIAAAGLAFGALLSDLWCDHRAREDEERLRRWDANLTSREEQMKKNVTEISVRLSRDALNVYQEINRRVDRIRRGVDFPE